jgi:shikimate kinase
MKRIFIIGYRATGKTTIGRKFSEELNIPFFDLDEIIVKKQGQDIKKIVENSGWDYFRKLERNSLKDFMALNESFVLSCGGGAVIHKDLWQNIENAFVIWLKAGAHKIFERIVNDPMTNGQRPSLDETLSLEDEITQKLEERTPLYKAFSNMAIETDYLDIDEIVNKIKGVIYGG